MTVWLSTIFSQKVFLSRPTGSVLFGPVFAGGYAGCNIWRTGADPAAVCRPFLEQVDMQNHEGYLGGWDRRKMNILPWRGQEKLPGPIFGRKP